ncbi:MAG TPA: MBL fold metallo-hydrolase, partial [Ilumatobacteraceae bacterium]|nr:MBL fold metallo-hydrolase [Ilumatobacteraceae bacterium]
MGGEVPLSDPIAVTFHGVRGSTPCNSPEITRYGGNTSCVSLDVPGHDPILFDMGTGMRYYGAQQRATGRAFRGSVLLTHMHWDHTQGLPFFTPIQCADGELTIYGPGQDDGRSVGDVLADIIKPPLFPVPISAFPGRLHFRDMADDDFVLSSSGPGGPDGGDVTVMSRLIPHIGRTCGYRVTWAGRSVTYMSDHQMPRDGSFTASDSALELAAGTDLLIHDSQYTDAEFAHKW